MRTRLTAVAVVLVLLALWTPAWAGDGSPGPRALREDLQRLLDEFRSEFEDYIRTHREPAVVVTPLQEAIAHGRSASRSNTTCRVQ